VTFAKQVAKMHLLASLLNLLVHLLLKFWELSIRVSSILIFL